MSKLLRVSNSKYRVVISDVLPFERPIFFSNRFFARFLKYYGVKVENDRLVATRNVEDEGLTEFLQLLGGNPGVRRPCFQYKITKDGHEDGRTLSVVHPFHQVKMVEFYERYKMLLIDFCQRSNYSIRFPYKVADYQKKQKGYYKLFSDDATPMDTSESLKHFFAYKHYKNINYFYDDFRFLRAEKKFAFLRKCDLEHCFENITPEILSQAMFNHRMKAYLGSLSYDFCKLQNDFLNLGKGIVIGPEFSRIYAEIVLQKIDSNVEKRLSEEKITLNKDYIFYRYVDDGFFFYNDANVQKRFFDIYSDELASYGLRINGNKNIDFCQRPFIDQISVIKQQLLQIVDKHFENRLDTFRSFVKMQEHLGQIDVPARLNFKEFVNEVRNVIRAKDDKVKYKDISSYLLGVVQTRLMQLLEDFNHLYKQYSLAAEKGFINEQGLKIKERYEREFIDFCFNIIEVLFYFLSCDMRMSTSIKVVSMINRLQLYVRGTYEISEYSKSIKFSQHYVERLDDKISDEIATFLQDVTPQASNLMEILNILELEKIMSHRNQISHKVLNNLWDRCDDKSASLNFFTVFEMFHFIKDSNGYADITRELYQWVDEKINSLTEQGISRTEDVLTFLEIMCCPWIKETKKRKYARILYGNSSEKIYSFAKKQQEIFIKWHGYHLTEAIQQMNSEEVY